jgi:medium-chain acyl-[acyl-carrier-protein] hydrolase
MSDPWILRLGPVPDATAAASLFCLPYAGGGAAAFRKWQPMLAPAVAVLPVQLPGRGTRLGESPRTRVLDLARELAAALTPRLDGRYALFGYSLGALIAFELARELRRRGAPAPEHLFACARRAPSVPEDDGHAHGLPDAAFVEEVGRRYEAIPAEVASEPEVLRLLLPALRADFEMLETYGYSEDEPLDCPITAIAGIDDARATERDIAGWARETRAGFSIRRFPGGHFFFRDLEGAVADLVRGALEVGAPAAARP